jgi:hypothetical protein
VAERRQRIVQSTGKLRDELLAGEIFYALAEAQVLIERWTRSYNQGHQRVSGRANSLCDSASGSGAFASRVAQISRSFPMSDQTIP